MKMTEYVAFDNRTQRLVGIDIAKAIAIVFVVLTHTALWMPGYCLWAGLAVPSFLMIGAFANARKATKMDLTKSACWYTLSNLSKYFWRISVPYLILCVAEVIVLPLINYTTLDMAFLNTLKGGMGPGGYYLVCFAQLFLIFPLLWCSYKRHPWLTVLVVALIQLTMSLLFGLVIIPRWAIAESVYKFLAFRFLLITMAGIILFDRFSRIPWWAFIVAALIGLALGLAIVLAPQAFAWDLAGTLKDLQLALYTFGITGSLIVFTSGIRYKHKNNPLSVFANSTLHILLFQQIYFCCVGARPDYIALDTFIAILGGVAFYLVWYWSQKLIKTALAKTKTAK